MSAIRLFPLSSLILLCCLSLVGCSTGRGIETAAVPIPDTRKEGPGGHWEGLISRGSGFDHAVLEFPETPVPGHGKATYPGTAYLQPFSEYLDEDDAETVEEFVSVPVILVHDLTTDTFRIDLGGGSDASGRRSLPIVGMRGVFDARGDAMTGWRAKKGSSLEQSIVDNGFSVFMRADKFNDFIDGFVALAKAGDSGIADMLLGGLSGVDSEDVRQWVSRYYASYPKANFSRLRQQGGELRVMPLFRDDHFSRYFGAPFDQLGRAALVGIGEVLSEEAASGTDGGHETGELSWMFQSGAAGAARTSLRVNALRHYYNWYQEQRDRVSSLPVERDSLAPLDRLEAQREAMGRIAFWPDELVDYENFLAQARQHLGYAILDGMITAWERQAIDSSMIGPMSDWKNTERDIFSTLDKRHCKALTARRDARLGVVLKTLVGRDRASLAATGEGLAGLKAGERWYATARQRYAQVEGHPTVKSLWTAFYEARRQKIKAAIPVMRERLHFLEQTMPMGMRPANDARRLAFCKSLHSLQSAWFTLSGDDDLSEAVAIRMEIERLGGLAAGQLPPGLVGEAGYTPLVLPISADEAEAWRSEVDAEASRWRGESIDLLLPYLKYTVTTPGFRFATEEGWALFYGRFDRLNRHFSGTEYPGLKALSEMLLTDPLFHYAFITWVGLSSNRFGDRQFGLPMTFTWKPEEGGNVELDDKGEVCLSNSLVPYYERSYKIAEKAVNISLYSANGGRNFIGALARMQQRSFGEFVSIGPNGDERQTAVWEGPILSDLNRLLDAWPIHSWGLWQFQTNLMLYLQGKPSLQQQYRWP